MLLIDIQNTLTELKLAITYSVYNFHQETLISQANS